MWWLMTFVCVTKSRVVSKTTQTIWTVFCWLRVTYDSADEWAMSISVLLLASDIFIIGRMYRLPAHLPYVYTYNGVFEQTAYSFLGRFSSKIKVVAQEYLKHTWLYNYWTRLLAIKCFEKLCTLFVCKVDDDGGLFISAHIAKFYWFCVSFYCFAEWFVCDVAKAINTSQSSTTSTPYTTLPLEDT